MYFKVTEGSETEKKLLALKERIAEVDAAAVKLLIEFGGTDDHYTLSGRGLLAGGIAAVKFQTEPDKALWRSVGEKYQRLFMPKAKNKEAWVKINALPNIKNEALNELVGFPGGLVVGEGLTIYHRPACSLGSKPITVQIPKGVKWVPNPDMVEITESEYQKITETEEE